MGGWAEGGGVGATAGCIGGEPAKETGRPRQCACLEVTQTQRPDLAQSMYATLPDRSGGRARPATLTGCGWPMLAAWRSLQTVRRLAGAVGGCRGGRAGQGGPLGGLSKAFSLVSAWFQIWRLDRHLASPLGSPAPGFLPHPQAPPAASNCPPLADHHPFACPAGMVRHLGTAMVQLSALLCLVPLALENTYLQAGGGWMGVACSCPCARCVMLAW